MKNCTSRQFHPGGAPSLRRSASDSRQRQATNWFFQSFMVASKAE